MQKSFLYGILLSPGMFLTTTYALESDHLITIFVPVTQGIKKSMSAQKEVYLMDAQLTPAQKQKILNYKNSNHQSIATPLPLAFDAGMNGTPVLDQSRHG